MNQRIIEVVDYNPDWAINFTAEKQCLTLAIGDNAIAIEHIGSTSIEGLSAKPIIDILIEVTCLKSLDEHNKKLKAIGYKAKGENGIAGRRYFEKGGKNRSHHVHAFATGDNNLTRHLAFKHYLIAHPELLTAYAEIKKRAAHACNNDSILYMTLKNDFIQQHEPLALKWFNAR